MNVERSRKLYRRNAPVYDLEARLFADIRAAAIARLAPREGETVLDLACGTGLSFDAVWEGIRDEGRIIGVDQSSEMLLRARRRIRQHGWTNVRIVQTDAAQLTLPPASVDAVLCCLAHDVASSREAMRAAAGALRDGGRFVAAGIKLAAGPFGLIANPLAKLLARAGVTAPLTPDPWRAMAEELGRVEVGELRWGTAYVASGLKRQGDAPR